VRGTAGTNPPSGRRHSIIGAAALTAALMALGLAACSADSPAPTPTSSAGPSAGPSSEPSTGPPPAAEPNPDPTLAPRLSASENLDYFDFIAAGVLRADPAAGGKAFIDGLVAGGFDKKTMEVTFDRTRVDLAADSIQFAVRVNDECLIGQNGPATGGYHSMVADVLSSGTCLVGGTRQIDW